MELTHRYVWKNSEARQRLCGKRCAVIKWRADMRRVFVRFEGMKRGGLVVNAKALRRLRRRPSKPKTPAPDPIADRRCEQYAVQMASFYPPPAEVSTR